MSNNTFKWAKNPTTGREMNKLAYLIIMYLNITVLDVKSTYPHGFKQIKKSETCFSHLIKLCCVLLSTNPAKNFNSYKTCKRYQILKLLQVDAHICSTLNVTTHHT